MRKRKPDFTKDMPFTERRKILDRRCKKCSNSHYDKELGFVVCKTYFNYWHYIREGICNQYKKKNLKT
jgi:hypothetical protein